MRAAADAFPRAERILGFDINNSHLSDAMIETAPYGKRVSLRQADFFAQDWSSIIQPELGPWLVIGNPPWVTSAELGTIASTNLPEKSNFQGRKGFDAITGKANFDISEWMLLQALCWLDGQSGSVAVLCKTAVARKVLAQAWEAGRSIAAASIFKINALAEFGAAVDACFFVLELGDAATARSCSVYDTLDAESPSQIMGFEDGHLISNRDGYERTKQLAGADPKYTWRSGVKHDCSKIMELRQVADGLVNGFGDLVDIEPQMTLPLLKSSDVGNGRLAPRARMIITQKFVGQNTDYIRCEYPKAWAYLTSHAELLDKRGSSIYKKSPRFSVFGVGGYTFSPWKVAISGFYKKLSFVVIPPVGGSPVALDDTIYFLSCSSEAEAKFIHELLTSDPAQDFLQSAVHWDEKRPITVGLLRRISLQKVAAALGRTMEYERSLGSRAFDKAA